MYCGKCGNAIKDNSAFCPYCGNKNVIKDMEIIQERKLPKKKLKNLTNIRNFMVFSAVAFCFLGFLSGRLAKEYEPLDVAFGYEKDGEMVIYEKYEKALGGNLEGVQRYKNISLYCYIAAVGCLAESIILSIEKSRLKKAKQMIKKGRILEKRGNVVAVEFEDNERKYLSVEPEIIVSVGEFGKMIFQNNILIEFQIVKEC